MTKQLPNGNALGEFIQKNLWAILLGGLAFYQTFVGYGNRLTAIEEIIKERRVAVAQVPLFESRISSLEKGTEDSFTGKDGERLEERIERLERFHGLQ